jgi:hypothetical protein
MMVLKIFKYLVVEKFMRELFTDFGLNHFMQIKQIPFVQPLLQT